MSVRCKMVLENVFANQWGGAKAMFRCSYDQKDPEDVAFAKATPTGQAEFVVDNQEAAKQLVIGRTYYFDISPVETPAASPTT